MDRPKPEQVTLVVAAGGCCAAIIRIDIGGRRRPAYYVFDGGQGQPRQWLIYPLAHTYYVPAALAALAAAAVGQGAAAGARKAAA